MRVLFFYQYFTTPAGSWSTRAYEFARRWVQAGDSVTVVTSVYDKSDLEAQGFVTRCEVDGIDVRVLNVRLSNKHGFVRRLFTFAAYAVLSSWYALTHRTDVVLASSGPITVGLPGLMAHWVRRRPLVFEARDLWPEGAIQLRILKSRWAIALARALERACYRFAHHVVALSPGMAAHVRRRSPRTRVAVVPNASDNELFGGPVRTLELPEALRSKRLVVYTGTLGTIDDCGQLLDLAAELKRRDRHDVAVAIVGDGSEGAHLRQRARDESLDNVHFAGLVDRYQVASWLALADVSMLVTKDVPFLDTCSPNKLFDAFAAGVPVVQTTQGWIRDLLSSEGCGRAVPPGDVAAMTDAVLELTDDDALRARASHHARRVALELFDRWLLARRLRGVLLEAAGHEDSP